MGGIEEGKDAKGKCNIFNKIITENFQNLKKVLPIQIQESPRIPNRLDQNTTCPWHIIIKITTTENRERILKAIREKNQIMYKGKSIKIIVDFSMETSKARRAWSEVAWALNEHNISTGILYLAKLSFRIN
jgi:hypothetical protein